MSTPVIMDAVAVGVVILLMALGAWRGLWKTLAGIVGFIAALVLAGIIASALTGPATDRAVSYVMEHFQTLIQDLFQEHEEQIQEILQEQLQEQGNQIQEQLKEQLPEQGTGIEEALSELAPGLELSEATITLDQLPDLLELLGITGERRDALMELIRAKMASLGQSTIASAQVALEEVVRQSLEPIIHAVIYAISFLLLSILLKIVLHFVGKALEAIPGLKTLNRVGGLVLGLTEGLLLLVVASWLIRTAGYTVEAPPLSDTVVLRFFAEHSLMDLFTSARSLV